MLLKIIHKLLILSEVLAYSFTSNRLHQDYPTLPNNISMICHPLSGIIYSFSKYLWIAILPDLFFKVLGTNRSADFVIKRLIFSEGAIEINTNG